MTLGERQRHELRERVLDEGRYQEARVLDHVSLHGERGAHFVALADSIDGLRERRDLRSLLQKVDGAVARQLGVRPGIDVPARH